MSASSPPSLTEANAEAVRRIRAAKACGQWWLDLGDLPIESVPEEIAELSDQLEVLALGKFRPVIKSYQLCGETALPTVISAGRHGKIRDLKPLRGLHKLNALDLSWCERLTTVEPLQGLHNLTILNLNGCSGLTMEPLQGLHNLTTLDLSTCRQLTTVELAQGLQNLTTLNLSWCQKLTTIESLRGLYNLTTLDLEECRELTTVEPLRGLHNLTSLSLNRCWNLTSVEPLQGLHNLTALDLSACIGLATLEPLRGLHNLTMLDLTLCRANSFESLHELAKLRDLRVYRSQFPDLHPSVCGRKPSRPSRTVRPLSDNSLNSVRAYYAALGSDAKPDAEIKVFVLGNARCGKSYLIRRLTGMTWEQIEAAKVGTTHGVTIVPGPAPAEWGLPHPVTLSVWDFGGQDIYHGTHALFLREPAVYLLLYADATENEDTICDGGFEMHNRRLDYWFDYLRQEAGNKVVVTSPVLFVQSQCDRSGEADQPPFLPPREQFPNLSPLIHASAKDDDGLDHLLPRLKRAIKELLKEHPQPPLPASWAKVRERIREMQQARSPRTMTLPELGALCAECGCGGDEVVLRDALALMGVVYYRKGVFDDRVIVDQAWALDAIYTLFQRDHKRQRKIDEQHGRFTREDLSDYFWDGKHPVADQRTFLGFMEQCGICFRAKPGYDEEYEGYYIIPDKLKPLAAEETRKFENTLKALREVVEVTATFRLLHDGIARSLLSKIGSAAGDRATYWRYGCHFFDGKTGAEALLRTDGNTVRIQAWGEKANELVETLVCVLKGVPCGQPPEVTWAEDADQPIIVGGGDREGRPEHRLDPQFPPGSDLARLRTELGQLTDGVVTNYRAVNALAASLAGERLLDARDGQYALRVLLTTEVLSRRDFRLFAIDLHKLSFDTGVFPGTIGTDLRALNEWLDKGQKGPKPAPKYPVPEAMEATAEQAVRDVRLLRIWSAHNEHELDKKEQVRVGDLFRLGAGSGVIDDHDKTGWLRMQVHLVKRFAEVLNRYLAAFQAEDARRTAQLREGQS